MVVNEREKFLKKPEESLTGRVQLFIRSKNMSVSKFEKSINKSNGYISKLTDNTGRETLEQIREFYPDFDVDYVLTGRSYLEKSIYNLNSNGVPYYEDIDVTASVITSLDDYKEVPTFYINYKHFNDCDAYVPVTGDSMYPKYCAGEIVAVKKIYNIDVLFWGETHLVITNENANSYRAIKDIHQHEDDDKIILRSSNPNYKGDTVINKADILSIYIVKGRIKRNQL